MTDVRGFLEDLSSSAPVPGGGSVAALQVAMAAALLAMVANLTLGRKKLEAVHDRAESARRQAVRLRDEAQTLVDRDAEAFAKVAAAMALPRIADDEKAVRKQRVQEALHGAALPPLQTMRVAAEVIALAGDLVEYGNPSAISDVGSGILAAQSGYHAARLNVEINLAAITDDRVRREIEQELRGVPDPSGSVEHVLTRVESQIRGEPG